jgi:6-phosphogluconolactonase
MKVTFLAAFAVGFALLFGSNAMAAVYTQTNAATGNAVHRLDRGPDGALSLVATYRTGGRGTSAGLGSQGAVALSDNGRALIAVDAGSNDIAAFHIGRRGHLTLDGRVPSGGTLPVSVDIDGSRAYVLNAGADANVTVFDLRGDGPHALATASLPGFVNAAQVSVSPDSRQLVVTDRASSRLATFPLRNGRLGAAVVTASSGPVPFGFAFTPRGDLIVSEAGNSTVSSYRDGSVVTASLPVGQGAACWVAVTPDGKFAYTGNATGSISGFAVNPDGSLRALNANGLTLTSPRPNDVAIVDGYLYVINPPAGEITGARINPDGSLTPLVLAPQFLGTGLAGLAAN